MWENQYWQNNSGETSESVQYSTYSENSETNATVPLWSQILIEIAQVEADIATASYGLSLDFSPL